MTDSTSGLEYGCNNRIKYVVFVPFKPVLFLIPYLLLEEGARQPWNKCDAPPISLLFFMYIAYFTQLTNRGSSALHQKGRNVVDKFRLPSISVPSTKQPPRTPLPFRTYLQCHAWLILCFWSLDLQQYFDLQLCCNVYLIVLNNFCIIRTLKTGTVKVFLNTVVCT